MSQRKSDNLLKENLKNLSGIQSIHRRVLIHLSCFFERESNVGSEITGLRSAISTLLSWSIGVAQKESLELIFPLCLLALEIFHSILPIRSTF